MPEEQNSTLLRYAIALKKINQNATEQQIVEVLTARDALQTALLKEEVTEHFGMLLMKTNELDSALRAHGELIATKVDLPSLRTVRQPAAEAWWWQFEKPVREKSGEGGLWSRFDWLYSSITAGALALAASLMMQIVQALSVGGMGWGETFAAIAQGGGLVLISSGTLTETGKKKVEEIMSRLGIQKKYRAEVICIASLVLLTAVYAVHALLPNHFYKKGNALYENSELSKAALKFQQGLQIDSDDARFHLELGKVYESMGNLEKALAEYSIIAETGDSWGLNDLGRTLMFEEKLKLAESYLKMALQRAAVYDGNDKNNLLYQVNRNLGWALLNQKSYEEAAPYLLQAVALDEAVPGKQMGGGMAYCLLSYAQEQLHQTAPAEQNWLQCMAQARPETVFEYKWFIDVGRGKDADRICTSKIVCGITEEQFKNVLAKQAGSNAGTPSAQ